MTDPKKPAEQLRAGNRRDKALAAVWLGLVCGWLTLASVAQAQSPTRDRRDISPTAPSPQTQAKLGALIETIYGPEAEFDVVLRRSKLVRTKRNVYRTAIADPTIIDAVQFGPRELAVIGRETGSTTLTLWFEGEDSEVLSYLVTVTRDPGVETQRQAEYGELEKMVNELFPNSKVRLIPIADKLVVKGQARDAKEASQIMSIIRGEVVNQQGQLQPGYLGPFINQGAAAAPFPDGSELPAANVINMLEVPGEMQVLLKVKIAELTRSALRQLGTDFDVTIFSGDDEFFISSLLSGSSNIVASAIFEDDAIVNAFITALATNGSMKILAEPNLVTLSGHTASFIAGGEFAVPTVVGVSGVEAATTQFRGFGTQLTFTPTVLDKDRIRLQVAPEFSTINQDNAVQGIPGLDTRAAFTTVDLREGQWLAIAGLLHDQQDGSNLRIPLLGDIPIVGAAFSSKSISRDETELVVLVSPELVHPIEPEEGPPLLPGMDVTEPDDIEFYLHGQLEGRPDCHHRSTVWPLYQDRIRHAKHEHKDRCENDERCERYYVSGPHGFTP